MRTVIATVSLTPSLAAMTFADPRVAPRTMPLVSTVATVALSLDHVIGRPEMMRPLESRSVARSFAAPPTTTVAESGTIVTDATGRGLTVTTVVPRAVPLVAVTVTLPGLTPVTFPSTVPAPYP